MNKNKMTFFAVGASLILVAAITFSFLFTGLSINQPMNIELPPDQAAGAANQSAPNTSVPQNLSENVVPVELNSGNVQRIIRTLNRIGAYSAQIDTAISWDTGSNVTKRQIWVKHGYTKTETLGQNNAVTSAAIHGGGLYYYWLPSGSSVYRSSANDLDADNAAGIPTYEDILSAPAESINSAEVVAIDGKQFISVSVIDDAIGAVNNYIVSVENGLLQEFTQTSNAKTVYTMKMTAFNPAAPDDSIFILPDGTPAWGVS